MALTTDDAAKLALLARLELSQEQLEHLAPQLDSILGFIDKLSELDTSDVEPMTTALDVDNCWRVDELKPGLDREAALSNAPASDEECFRVPPVLG
ncbi:Asp-tRNA(Asn)/Glu-tRNA(Gln) amidotransferase subunit GatC [Rhodopirellula sp. MGV]|uniref:Asp-tRNA(Asn)/Glu-tRNA(Gln) amidotransferase subunit GatC n=1 Tax=Rhodopirellula sp. MGV TaxID=2023130 RepID=UPI000B969283|nr:Asp-tRNA(Asn)/Glu-tRNA(Gln) amidotransferase subunit GatC [Rhodopirellula sp. MGV]OYP38936.1 Asp-tRNA(Asn)/Glu-tRNA(Gln) amidotransferase GatCAB subunit C [Rhodopirellula sp. MGV]PNY37612.1 Asp-tRNA(Asn)/Glu-tRNA(Gln) amidotransferase subunit GatC [Rhodopirellula baltica]